MRYIIQSLLGRFNYQLARIGTRALPPLIADGRSTLLPHQFHRINTIPGMITSENGAFLYLLAYGSGRSGDIVELGSWQGRSTCFLAQACKDGGRGIVHAVDHFKGNPGRESQYQVTQADLGDLKDNFLQNIERMGLKDYIRLYDMEAEVAGPILRKSAKPLRLLFIDANHAYETTAGYINEFVDLVMDGGLIVFDDYSAAFPGVIQAVEELILDSPQFEAPIQYANTLVVRKTFS